MRSRQNNPLLTVFPTVAHFADATPAAAAAREHNQEETGDDVADDFTELAQRLQALIAGVLLVVDRASNLHGGVESLVLRLLVGLRPDQHKKRRDA